ncbi:hypothetical protein [Shewanella sp. NIFS-20-20]|uniref:hypothetical protein n=1 Tax=Shewanella sp. NIFS-20-20 TaxID=2853806 RepID=UPI001C448E2E|nr:hypothetical protein [Shewanella sp. NIFS-20-20]MBV7316510.1 hypothetical protein [Shewanella sp. NIFS-20-20]
MTITAHAACPNAQDYGQVEFAKNSSYFSEHGQALLDKINTSTADNNVATGYLMLEFSAGLNRDNDKLKEYNKWLAQRRIERIKTYLATQEFEPPIVSRILTIANNPERSVQLYWCPESDQEAQLATR